MYYCNNCDGRFAKPVNVFMAYADFGGEWHAHCPLCNAPENFTKREENGSDDERNEAVGSHGAKL